MDPLGRSQQLEHRIHRGGRAAACERREAGGRRRVGRGAHAAPEAALPCRQLRSPSRSRCHRPTGRRHVSARHRVGGYRCLRSRRGGGGGGGCCGGGLWRALLWCRLVEHITHELEDAVPLKLVVGRQQRRAQLLRSIGRRGGESPSDGPRQRDFVDVELGIHLARDALESEEGADEQDDVRRRVHAPQLTHLKEHHRQRAEA
mmetsp:Transcript_52466/g.135921  ORF Transcript_52466/g.135921 Transcript_52466/m.135921 type:complete len:203 (-) Transcript_52466:33-641(-)